MPRAMRSPPFSAWSTTSLAMCSAAMGSLPSAHRSPTASASGVTIVAGEGAESAKRELLGDEPLEPLPVEVANGIQQRRLRRAVGRPGLRLGEDVLARARGQVADPLAAFDEPGEGAEQRDLIGGVGPVAVCHPLRPHHFVAAFPRPQARGREAGQLGHLVDLVGAIGGLDHASWYHATARMIQPDWRAGSAGDTLPARAVRFGSSSKR